jgi:hypothetical protein
MLRQYRNRNVATAHLFLATQDDLLELSGTLAAVDVMRPDEVPSDLI